MRKKFSCSKFMNGCLNSNMNLYRSVHHPLRMFRRRFAAPNRQCFITYQIIAQSRGGRHTALLSHVSTPFTCSRSIFATAVFLDIGVSIYIRCRLQHGRRWVDFVRGSIGSGTMFCVCITSFNNLTQYVLYQSIYISTPSTYQTHCTVIWYTF